LVALDVAEVGEIAGDPCSGVFVVRDVAGAGQLEHAGQIDFRKKRCHCYW
jgi:hypothetical protein